MNHKAMASLGPDTLVKALRSNRTHRGLTYVLGRNECPQPFDKEECADGGLYACRLKHLFHWVALYADIDHVAVAEIPEDAQRVEFTMKTKASALVLTRFLPLADAMASAIEHGADVASALPIACDIGHLPVAQFLVAHGADVHENEDAALRWAAEQGHVSIVQFLLSNGANVHAGKDYALFSASRYGHLPVVQCLLAHGADVHALHDDALRVASRFGRLSVVQCLVDHGADVHALDDQALRSALEYGHPAVAKYLASL